MKVNKVIRGVISLLLASTLLVGCNQPSVEENNAAASVNESKSETADASSGKSGDTKVIDWFLCASPVPSPWNMDMPVLAEITNKTGVIFQANAPAQDADTKLNLLMANGDLPDVITITNQTLWSDLIASDMVWDIQEFFETYMPESAIINGQFPEDIKKALITRDGGWYCISSHLQSVDNEKIWGVSDATKDYWNGMKTENQFTIAFNQVMMEELGLTKEDITTEQGILDALCQVKEAKLTNEDGGSVYPLMIQGDEFVPYSIISINNLFGAMPVDVDGNYQSEYYSEQFKDGIEFLNECYRLGVLDPNIMTMEYSTVNAMTNDDRVFCYLGGTAAPDINRKVKDENGNPTDKNVWICPGPIEWKSGYRPALGINSAVYTGWLQTFISKDCENPEAIAKFIDFMMSEEGQTLWNYGIEGEDYFVNERGLYERTTTGQEKFDNMATTGVGAFWMVCNLNFDRRVSNVTTNIEDTVAAVMGLSSETYLYDTIALQMPSGYIEPGSKYDVTGIEVSSYLPQQLAKIILAESDEAFETLYGEFIQQLDKLGLRELDTYKNEMLQKNYETYDYKLKAINE